MKTDDIYKITFRTLEAHYDFFSLFGLTNTPSTFLALMNNDFRPLFRQFMIVFFDDIFVCSKNLSFHLSHLTIVLETLKSNKLFAKKSKYHFACRKLSILGAFDF